MILQSAMAISKLPVRQVISNTKNIAGRCFSKLPVRQVILVLAVLLAL